MANARWDQKTRWRKAEPGALLLTERDPDNAAAARADRGIFAADLMGQFRNGLTARQALVFNGAAGVLGVNLPTLGVGDYTLAFWVRPETQAIDPYLIMGAGAPRITVYINRVPLTVSLNNGGDLLVTSIGLVSGVWGLVVFSRLAGTVTAYINAVAAGSAADATNYPIITDIGRYAGDANSIFKGGLVPYIYNRALSAAEVATLYENIVPAASDYYGSTVGTAIAAGSFVVGKRYRIATAGTTDFTLIGAANSSVGTEFVATGVGAGTGTATAIGLLLAPAGLAPGNGYVWHDHSGVGAHLVLPASGVDWAVPGLGANRIRGTTSTNGNQRLLAATTLLPANVQITRVRARSRTGTPSITVGTSSGGAEIVASVALSTTWKDLTIALTGGIVSTADDVWIGSNSTDVVEIDLAYEPLGF